MARLAAIAAPLCACLLYTSVLLMDTDHVILSSVTPETIAARMEEKNAEETSVQP